MSGMIVATIIYIALSIFILLMWIRFIFDLIAGFARGFRPRGAALVIADISYRVTDPPVKFVRRFVPPLRLSGITLDFSWSIVLIVAIIVASIVGGYSLV